MANLAPRDLNQSRTSNFGPLTTTFTPPSSCSSLAVQISVPNYAGAPFYAPYSDCDPGTALFSFYWGYKNVNLWYTPGLSCPKGYTTAAAWGGGVEQLLDNAPGPGESAYLCCPS
jgi:hypothetical protein